jgi:hypothetical protein
MDLGGERMNQGFIGGHAPETPYARQMICHDHPLSWPFPGPV